MINKAENLHRREKETQPYDMTPNTQLRNHFQCFWCLSVRILIITFNIYYTYIFSREL